MLDKLNSKTESWEVIDVEIPCNVTKNIVLTKLWITNFINPRLENFLKILVSFEIKTVSRNCSNNYICWKTKEEIERKETDWEHITDCFRLSDVFILIEKEFRYLDRLKVNDLLLYHDDCEIVKEDKCISDREWRKNKHVEERAWIKLLVENYPEELKQRVLDLDEEFRYWTSEEAKFARAIDRIHPLVSELKYPWDRWEKKKFDEINVRKWFIPALEYSQTFMKYFEDIILFLRLNWYFED